MLVTYLKSNEHTSLWNWIKIHVCTLLPLSNINSLQMRQHKIWQSFHATFVWLTINAEWQCHRAARSFHIPVRRSYQFTHHIWDSMAMPWDHSNFPNNRVPGMRLISSLTLSGAVQQCCGATVSFLTTVYASISSLKQSCILSAHSPFLGQYSNVVGLL